MHCDWLATISYRQGAHSLNSVISFLKKILLNFRFQHLFIQVIWFSSTVKSESVSRSAMSNSLHLVECSLPGSSVHGDSPGKNTRVGSHVFLQGIFLVQGLYTGLLHCRQILYQLSYQWSPESPIIQVRSYFAIIYIYIHSATTFDPSFYLFIFFWYLKISFFAVFYVP